MGAVESRRAVLLNCFSGLLAPISAPMSSFLRWTTRLRVTLLTSRLTASVEWDRGAADAIRSGNPSRLSLHIQIRGRAPAFPCDAVERPTRPFQAYSSSATPAMLTIPFVCRSALPRTIAPACTGAGTMRTSNSACHARTFDWATAFSGRHQIEAGWSPGLGISLDWSRNRRVIDPAATGVATAKGDVAPPDHQRDLRLCAQPLPPRFHRLTCALLGLAPDPEMPATTAVRTHGRYWTRTSDFLLVRSAARMLTPCRGP